MNAAINPEQDLQKKFLYLSILILMFTVVAIQRAYREKSETENNTIFGLGFISNIFAIVATSMFIGSFKENQNLWTVPLTFHGVSLVTLVYLRMTRIERERDALKK